MMTKTKYPQKIKNTGGTKKIMSHVTQKCLLLENEKSYITYLRWIIVAKMILSMYVCLSIKPCWYNVTICVGFCYTPINKIVDQRVL